MTNLILTTLSSTNRIKRELVRGDDYKNRQKNAILSPIHPTQSPVDITFFIQKRRRVHVVEEEIQPSDCVTETRRKNPNGKCCRSKSEPYIENSFWERAKLTHKQYIDLLSTPCPKGGGDNTCDKKQSVPVVCSQRISQMACPNRRLVLETWRDFGRQLPAVALHRFYDMLYSKQNTNLKDARKFFKIYDRRKKQLERKRKLKKRKRKHRSQVLWINEQIEETSTAILTFFSGEARQELSFKQLLLSDVILVVLAKLMRRCEPILRFSSDAYDKELVLIVDKIAIWVENVSRIVEIQALEEEDEIMQESDQPSKVSSELLGADDKTGLKEDGKKKGIGEKGSGIGEGIDGVSSLQKLIQILANASSGYLSGTIEDFQNITRHEILNKIKILNKDYKGMVTPAELLKKILLEWALHSRPSQVDVTIIKKIEEVSELLAAMLTAEDLYGLLSTLKGEPSMKEEVSARSAAVTSEIVAEIDFGEDDQPLEGTMTEMIKPDGSVEIGVVNEFGDVTSVRLTPSGNLIPTVYDKKGKVVDELYDKDGNRLEVTFQKNGVPEPNTYNGPLFDDVAYAHELIFNDKGKIIPLCYDKFGNPIAPAYDEKGNPIWFGPDGKPISVPPGCHVKWVDGKMVIIGPEGDEVTLDQKDIEKEMEEQLGEGSYFEEEEEETEEEEEEEEESEEETLESREVEKIDVSPTGSRESMITVIKGHKPKKIREHSKDTVCCLSLKIWAVWLLEITHNAHNWTKWIGNVIGEIREFAAILRGEVFLPNGQKKVLFKSEWNTFIKSVDEDIIAWKQYSRHVNDLTNRIIEKFHGKPVFCCEKCLQDHLIKNVVIAHETMRALTEALNCAGYWQRCLDEIVQATSKLMEVSPDVRSSSSDIETGWSYTSSSDDDRSSYSTRMSKLPSSKWREMISNPCPCPCSLKQLFFGPTYHRNNIPSYTVTRPSLPRKYYL